MDLKDIGTATQLWRRWVLMSAGHAALDRTGFEIRRADSCGHVEDGTGAWLRLRRLGGNRAVLWGHHPELPYDDAYQAEILDSVPDWAYELDSAHAARRIGFLGWYARGTWSTVADRFPDEVGRLLEPVSCDEMVARWWRSTWRDASEDRINAVLEQPEGTSLAAIVGAAAAARASRQITLGASWVGHQLSDTATAHLRTAIQQQMRGAEEVGDRGHPARPTLLRQWARVNLDGIPFRHAVCAVGGTASFVPAANDAGLGETAQRSLDNVLHELRIAESDDASGAWLFARVTSDGRGARIERAYDSWPAWYVAPGVGPTMAALHAEMLQRTPAWRPPWASLLPAERF